MPIDTSIYSNIKPVQMDMPSPLDTAQKAMALSSLGMQQAQMARQVRTQQATQEAFAKNTDPSTGRINQQGALSDLYRVAPQAAMELEQHFAKMGKEQADAKSAQLDAAQKALTITGPHLKDFIKNTPEDQKPTVWPELVKNLKSQGVDTTNLEHPYDPSLVAHYERTWDGNKQHLENMLTEANISKTQAETAKTKSETYKRNPDTLGQINDPAKLVPGQVPKEHQTKAFSEIDAAENTKRMSKSIMEAFEKATQENTNIRTGFGLVRTPGSVMALHQALQPTFKDLEGTVRQAAMDNTFHNITPAPGDSETKIQEKRQALEEYLQSKASAPTARAYGIDLAKFDSTSAYKSPNKGKSKGGGSMTGSNSAYAGERPDFDNMSAEQLRQYIGGK